MLRNLGISQSLKCFNNVSGVEILRKRATGVIRRPTLLEVEIEIAVEIHSFAAAIRPVLTTLIGGTILPPQAYVRVR